MLGTNLCEQIDLVAAVLLAQVVELGTMPRNVDLRTEVGRDEEERRCFLRV